MFNINRKTLVGKAFATHFHNIKDERLSKSSFKLVPDYKKFVSIECFLRVYISTQLDTTKKNVILEK